MFQAWAFIEVKPEGLVEQPREKQHNQPQLRDNFLCDHVPWYSVPCRLGYKTKQHELIQEKKAYVYGCCFSLLVTKICSPMLFGVLYIISKLLAQGEGAFSTKQTVFRHVHLIFRRNWTCVCMCVKKTCPVAAR